MFKPLLIHKDNTPIQNVFDTSNSIEFDTDSFDFRNSDLDTFITTGFIPKVENKEFNIIFIKDNLSDNYLELYGIILAYHIRLSPELKEKRYVPIIIISDIDGYILNKLDNLANILFTKNTFIGQNNVSTYDYYKKVFDILPKFTDFKKEFLDKIVVEQPKDYLTHHDIANEWSIHTWAKFLKIKDSPVIDNNREKISSMLYFKYLLAKYPVQDGSKISFAPKRPQSTGKILYIDDQWKEGWSEIFEEYYSKTPDIKFNTFEYEYKDMNVDNFLNELRVQLKSSMPDMILLDLRLTKKDHEETNHDQLTGIKILNIIEEINKGIQVVMFTATTQSGILEKLYDKGILGYIQKEHPDRTQLNMKDTFLKFKSLTDSAFEKSYLKKIWTIQEKILMLDFFNDTDNEKIEEIEFEVRSIFEVLNSQLHNQFVFSMLAIFKCIEILVTMFIEEKRVNYSRHAYWIKTGEKIGNFKRNEYYPHSTSDEDKNDSTINKIRILIYEKFNIQDEDTHDILSAFTKRRNSAIHPKQHQQELPITEEEILEWFKVLCKILQSYNKLTN